MRHLVATTQVTTTPLMLGDEALILQHEHRVVSVIALGTRCIYSTDNLNARKPNQQREHYKLPRSYSDVLLGAGTIKTFPRPSCPL